MSDLTLFYTALSQAEVKLVVGGILDFSTARALMIALRKRPVSEIDLSALDLGISTGIGLLASGLVSYSYENPGLVVYASPKFIGFIKAFDPDRRITFKEKK